eukprot:TRINITY_DN29619_c0_g1_i2.p2 TRINITY_DN29619_c0_g1~~TRINITY_DN29619_c0_g1_i2.p2  ORF type:complete len:127 (-),score=17.33 TRINITY_DN29619_c0_g1_i2:12-392(-)
MAPHAMMQMGWSPSIVFCDLAHQHLEGARHASLLQFVEPERLELKVLLGPARGWLHARLSQRGCYARPMKSSITAKVAHQATHLEEVTLGQCCSQYAPCCLGRGSYSWDFVAAAAAASEKEMVKAS